MIKRYQEMQDIFCKRYVIDLNATKAAIEAGYSKKTARSKGCQLLTKVNIQDKIQELKKERLQRLEVEADSVVRELAKIAFSNIKNYLDIDGDEVYFKDLKGVPDELTAAIESVKVVKKTIRGKREDDDDVELSAIQFKLHNKENALEQLAKHFGLFKEDNAQKKLEVRTYTIKEIKMLIMDSDRRDKSVASAGVAIVE